MTAPKTLHDGTVVSSSSEEWRHECEARYIIALPSLARRRAMLYGTTKPDGTRFKGIQGHRGEAEVKRLERTMMALWKRRGRNDG